VDDVRQHFPSHGGMVNTPRQRGQPVCAGEAGILAVTILQQKQQLFSMKKIPPGNNQDSD
jgi:hypothetical protein